MELKIDPQQVKEFVSEAILRQLDSQGRDELIRRAIAHLLEPQKGSYYKDTPLQEAFYAGCRQIAYDVVGEQLKEDEQVRSKIREIMNKALDKVFNEQADALIGELANAISQAFTVKTY